MAVKRDVLGPVLIGATLLLALMGAYLAGHATAPRGPARYSSVCTAHPTDYGAYDAYMDLLADLVAVGGREAR